MRKIAWILAAALLALGLAWGAALGEEAEAPDLTGDCSFTLCASKYGDARLRNGDYTKGWESKKIRNPYVVIHSEEPMYGLYLCFRQMPTSWELQVKAGEGKDDWKTLIPGDTRFHHTFYELDGLRTVRIYSTQEKAHVMGFNEIYVFGRGRIPDWVQRWEEPVEKADILFLSAHQDDELIFLGGTIPYYATALKKPTVVVYMANCTRYRRNEAGRRGASKGKHLWLRLRNDNHVVTGFWSEDGKHWTLDDWGMEVSGFSHHTLHQFQSLLPGVFVEGNGSATFRNFRYRTLPADTASQETYTFTHILNSPHI